ncbi:hypothetical protein AA0Z99_00175 [Agrococcus sp. 1P02AA]|uniref:hypothetical protein n=1 Tax=Agrococcus sp. 1P02AA TaxID=3132259 RepID=UPI0039A59AEB
MASESRQQARVAAQAARAEQLNTLNGMQMPRGSDLAHMTREQHLSIVAAIYDTMLVPGGWIGPIEVRDLWVGRAQLHATLAASGK